MVELQHTRKENKLSLKNGEWEIVINDPDLDAFSFNHPMSNKYVVTEVVSPLGQKVTLYNTVPKGDSNIQIALNMADIDQTRISSLKVSSNEKFFEIWEVRLIDNRDGSSLDIKEDQQIPIHPVIELNKLISMGFTGHDTQDEKPLFELKLNKRS